MALLSNLGTKAATWLTMPAELAGRLHDVETLLRPAEHKHRSERGGVGDAPRFAESALGKALHELDDDGQRAAALWAHRRVCEASSVYEVWPAMELVNALARRRLAWTAAEVDWALRLGLRSSRDAWDVLERLRLPVSAAERLPRGDLLHIEEALRRAVLRVSNGEYIPPADRQRMLRRLEALLADPAATLTALPPSLLTGGDLLSSAVRTEFDARLHAPGVPALLMHACSAGGPNPSGKWLKQGCRLLAEAEDGTALLRDVLGRALQHRETLEQQRWEGLDEVFDVYVWVHESTALLLRGLVLIAGQLDEPWVTPLLGELVLYAGGGNGGSASSPRDLVVTNAAVAALAQRPGSVPHLARAQARLKHRGVLKGVAKGLETAASNAGLTQSELLEAAVPTHGLDVTGTRVEPVGRHSAQVRVEPPGTVTLTFYDEAGRRLAGVPTAVKQQHAQQLAALRTEIKEIKRTVTTERLRLEGLLAEDRAWPYDDWVRLYRDHPLLGRLVRGLLWQVGDGTSWTTGRLHDDGTLTACDGSRIDRGGQVQLWHPARADVQEVRDWRSALLDAGLRQPFKQAFREIYLLTPAEIRTHEYSNRFAAHVLRAPQAQALMRARGWSGSSLGYYDGGYDGHVTRQFGDEWRGDFFFDLIESDDDDYGTPSLASSDQVRFSRRVDRQWMLRPLAEVPPLIFSEAMRDVDLFVGVTSIAADPTWTTRGARNHETYWQRTSFGDLTESAKTRREALLRLVPRLNIAGQCTVTDRFLEVRGSLRTYKIHLGSGNILMTPNDEYLCIVPGRGDKGPKVYLPFEEDGGMLSVILSKAFLLANDAAISDTSITAQIRD